MREKERGGGREGKREREREREREKGEGGRERERGSVLSFLSLNSSQVTVEKASSPRYRSS